MEHEASTRLLSDGLVHRKAPCISRRETDRQTDREREEEVEVNSMSLTKNYAEKSVETFSVSPEKGTCKHITLRFDKENKYFNIFWLKKKIPPLKLQ